MKQSEISYNQRLEKTQLFLTKDSGGVDFQYKFLFYIKEYCIHVYRKESRPRGKNSDRQLCPSYFSCMSLQKPEQEQIGGPKVKPHQMPVQGRQRERVDLCGQQVVTDDDPPVPEVSPVLPRRRQGAGDEQVRLQVPGQE